MSRIAVDLTGRKIGEWLILARCGSNSRHKALASLPPGYDPTIRVIYSSELEDDGTADKLRRQNEDRLAKIQQQAEKLQRDLPEIDLSRISFDGIGGSDGDAWDDGEEMNF